MLRSRPALQARSARPWLSSITPAMRANGCQRPTNERNMSCTEEHSLHSGDILFRTFHNATSRDESYSVHSRRMLKHVAYMYNELSPSRLQEASEHGGSGYSRFARQCFVSRFVFVFTIGGVSNVLLPTLRPPVSCTP